LSKLSVLEHTCNTSLAAGDSDPDHYIQLHILEHISLEEASISSKACVTTRQDI